MVGDSQALSGSMNKRMTWHFETIAMSGALCVLSLSHKSPDKAGVAPSTPWNCQQRFEHSKGLKPYAWLDLDCWCTKEFQSPGMSTSQTPCSFSRSELSLPKSCVPWCIISLNKVLKTSVYFQIPTTPSKPCFHLPRTGNPSSFTGCEAGGKGMESWANFCRAYGTSLRWQAYAIQ